MDSKIPPSHGDQPPPYSLTPSTPPSSTFHPSSLTSHLHNHLVSIPDRIRQSQQARNAQQTASDIALLDHLVPVVEAFLANLGEQHTAPPLATLTLVPDAAVPHDAELSGLDDMRQRGEVGQVFRVNVDRDKKGSSSTSRPAAQDSSTSSGIDQSWAPGREFTGWGRWDDPSSSSSSSSGAPGSAKLLWWRDENTARRLASYLQPPKPKKKPTPQAVQLAGVASRSTVQAAVEQRIPAEKEKKSWGWGRRRERDSSGSSSPAPSFAPVMAGPGRGVRGTVENGDVAGISEVPLPLEDEEKKAEMNVSAQEVAFRRENEFGIWESSSGWAIVVAVKLET